MSYDDIRSGQGVGVPDEDDGVVMVPNPYRRAVVDARSASVAPAARLEAALSDARNALSAGAWVGGTSEDFSAELDGYRRAVNDAGPAALAEFDDALGSLPAMVDSDSWYVRWRNLGPR